VQNSHGLSAFSLSLSNRTRRSTPTHLQAVQALLERGVGLGRPVCVLLDLLVIIAAAGSGHCRKLLGELEEWVFIFLYCFCWSVDLIPRRASKYKFIINSDYHIHVVLRGYMYRTNLKGWSGLHQI